MVHDVEYSFLFIYAVFLTASANYDPFSDNTHFSIHFPGPFQASTAAGTESDSGAQSSAFGDITNMEWSPDDSSVVVMTQDKEKYKCIIPDVPNSQTKEETLRLYSGPSEEVLLNPLFEQQSCSYKIEPYWTYELCHRKFLRQYHEEKDTGKEVKLQEYYLGVLKKTEEQPTAENVKEGHEPEKAEDDQLNVMQIGSQPYRFFEVNLTEGTMCDLTGHPRMTSVKYICHDLGRGEIYDLKETSTCQYEVIILTQLLCTHPLYRPQREPVNTIKCHSLDGAPQQPISLVNFELENSLGRHTKTQDTNEVNMNAGNAKKSSSPPPTGETRKPTPKASPAAMKSDKQLLKDFLSGEYCIQGGTGWWKHEFCYGKSVTQFHEERSGKIVVNLGVWNEEAHMDWIEAHPHKRPSQIARDKKVIHQFYTGGDVCDLTNKPRVTEVKLRCKDNPSHPNSIALYLVEPKSCEYNLVVESQILCPIIIQADDDGVIWNPEL